MRSSSAKLSCVRLAASARRSRCIVHAVAAATPPGSPPRLLVPASTSLPDSWEAGTVLLIDKPQGWTRHVFPSQLGPGCTDSLLDSFDVCAKLRGALQRRKLKVGHAGTLDPMATGLLILCTGKATHWLDHYQAQEKEYSGTLRLGEGTASYDAEIAVSERSDWTQVSCAQLAAAALTFVGDILQTPPMFSALKRDGVPLYKLARQGEVVERAQRQLHVARFDVWRDSPTSQDVHFTVVCSKGTYIRSLAHDLGRALGTHAHLVALRREAIGPHRVADAWQLQTLTTLINASRSVVAQ